jgi:hypothetical protein
VRYDGRISIIWLAVIIKRDTVHVQLLILAGMNKENNCCVRDFPELKKCWGLLPRAFQVFPPR